MEDITMVALLHFSKYSRKQTPQNNLMMMEIEGFARRNNFPVPLAKHYAQQMEKYIAYGTPYGDNTDGFLNWLHTQKKATK
jgi:hypothetical protein